MMTKHRIARALRGLVDPDTRQEVTIPRLAKVAKCSEKTVGRWFSGKARTSLPDSEQLRLIAKEFSLSTDAILGLPTEQPRTQVKSLPELLGEHLLTTVAQRGGGIVTVSPVALGRAALALCERDLSTDLHKAQAAADSDTAFALVANHLCTVEDHVVPREGSTDERWRLRRALEMIQRELVKRSTADMSRLLGPAEEEQRRIDALEAPDSNRRLALRNLEQLASVGIATHDEVEAMRSIVNEFPVPIPSATDTSTRVSSRAATRPKRRAAD
jgi:hypothetical protein